MTYQTTLSELYQDFNNRNIDAVLAFLHADVDWPNGWEGGSVHGQQEVRAYWLRQWLEINPNVEPVSYFERTNGDIAVEVHQLIKDLNGQILNDGQVTHVYTFEEGKVRKMVIE